MTSAALDMQTGSLPPTASYARRDWVWMPADPCHWSDGRIGTLTIILQHANSRPGCKQEVDHYGVQEETELGLPSGIRSFLLENDSDPDEYGPFRCMVGGMVETCGCEAGGADRRRREPTSCKHRDALKDMIEQGVI